jgi:preprotein translocase subunit SecG
MSTTMSAWLIVISIIQLLVALAVVAIVLFQSGKSAGLSGAIGGVADTFMAKNKARDLDAKLAKATKWVAIGFVVLTLLLNILA